VDPEDIDIFVDNYGQIKTIFDEHRNENEDEDWIRYNGSMSAFTAACEEFVRKDASDAKFEALQSQYQELLACKVPQELAGILESIGWKNDGNKKLLTIMMCWGFLYTGEAIQNADIPKWTFKLFVEKYYVRTMDMLELFDERDVSLITANVERITAVMGV
jgi:hypothetical protein